MISCCHIFTVLYVPGIFPEEFRLVCPFPRKLDIGTAEMSVSRSLFVDRPPEVQVPDDGGRPKSKCFLTSAMIFHPATFRCRKYRQTSIPDWQHRRRMPPATPVWLPCPLRDSGRITGRIRSGTVDFVGSFLRMLHRRVSHSRRMCRRLFSCL